MSKKGSKKWQDLETAAEEENVNEENIHFETN